MDYDWLEGKVCIRLKVLVSDLRVVRDSQSLTTCVTRTFLESCTTGLPRGNLGYLFSPSTTQNAPFQHSIHIVQARLQWFI